MAHCNVTGCITYKFSQCPVVRLIKHCVLFLDTNLQLKLLQKIKPIYVLCFAAKTMNHFCVMSIVWLCMSTYVASQPKADVPGVPCKEPITRENCASRCYFTNCGGDCAKPYRQVLRTTVHWQDGCFVGFTRGQCCHNKFV